ncbi:UxaA family hydrolase [Chloroflexota bacterium]
MTIKNQTLHLHPTDNVAIAKAALQPGMEIVVDLASNEQKYLSIQDEIPPGHKVALTHLEPGDIVRRYGEVIGTISEKINPGEHIHTHNLAIVHQFEGEILDAQVNPVTPLAEPEQRTFLGFPRPDGKVGTRNFIAVMANVNCSAFVCRQIAAHFTAERLAPYPNVDGVIALTHGGGCSSTDRSHLQRTMAGMARHPNIGSYITVGLGCEGNQPADLARDYGMPDPDLPIHPGEPAALTIQGLGGTRAAIQAGIAAVDGLLPRVNAVQRVPQPVSKLTLALECGGSDSWSGITANPLVGCLADEIVRQGGSVVISETPEVYGAQHILAGRAVSPEVGERLLAKIEWWRDYLQLMGGDFDDNPAPGNKAGGLTNICEKSLGAITKGGSTPLMAVYDYAEPIHTQGFGLMDTPGYDPASVTGMVAGGCNMVLFTTGRGSVAGFKPAPVIKISTNTQTYQRLSGDMDINAGAILDGDSDFPASTKALFEMVVDVASGKQSKSEALGMGEVEFVPWNPFGFV